MATTKFTSFKPKRVSKNNFWFNLGIEDAKTTRADAVHQGFKPKVYRNLAEKTKLSQSEFCKITHIPLSTMKRKLTNDERFSTQESDAIYRLAMLIKLATDLFSDEKKALDWIRESVYGLGGKRPLDMVATTVDFEMVKDLIGRVDHGVFS
ncbi:antitoxin Xre/MbcA/ParS toxin-binding domain-containing protein [Marinospirillum sp.]|uniref:type II RES/Xre toxin-antitoxin system antitoxin n=1 Tax=Marinospirillum sp. TaxID=2183934 RepID=UPI00384EAFED